MTDVNLDKIKDRIAKLLRMAQDSSSPHEAAIAAGRARSLMDKYQVSELDLADEADEAFDRRSATRFYAAIPQYMSEFAVTVAKYNDCQARFEYGYVTYKKKAGDKLKWGKRIEFLGYASDVQLAIQMYDSLLAAVDALCEKFLEGKGYEKYPVGVGNKFKVGAIDEVSRRIRAMTVERDTITLETGPDAGKGLVLFKAAAVNVHFGEVNYTETKRKLVTDESEVEAYCAGRIAAKMIEITKSLG